MLTEANLPNGYDWTSYDVARLLGCTDQSARNLLLRYPRIAIMGHGGRLRFHRPTVERIAALRKELASLTVAA